jgi:hypothetical protein
VSFDAPLPHFSQAGLTPQQVMLVLGNREANAKFFQKLRSE